MEKNKIRKRAHDIYLYRILMGVPGTAEDDWRCAEQELWCEEMEESWSLNEED